MNQIAFSWNILVKKKASGLDGGDLGRVQEVKGDLIVTKEGLLIKKLYFLPKSLVSGFDAHAVYFRIMKAEALQFQQRPR